MKLEFKLLSLKECSKYLKNLKNSYERIDNPIHEFKNEFVVVGENEENYKVQQLHEQGMNVFSEIDIAFIALEIPKKEFKWDGNTYAEIDIPKKNLSLDTIDDIKRLNDDTD